MDWPFLVVLATSLLGLVIVGVSSVVFYGIVSEINAASPEDQRLNFWDDLDALYVHKRHRELFPDSRRRSRAGWLLAVGLLVFFGAIISRNRGECGLDQELRMQ